MCDDCLTELWNEEVMSACFTEWQVYIPATDCIDSNHGSDWFVCSSRVCIVPYCWSDLLSYWQRWWHSNQLFHVLSWGHCISSHTFNSYFSSISPFFCWPLSLQITLFGVCTVHSFYKLGRVDFSFSFGCCSCYSFIRSFILEIREHGLYT